MQILQARVVSACRMTYGLCAALAPELHGFQ